MSDFSEKTAENVSLLEQCRQSVSRITAQFEIYEDAIRAWRRENESLRAQLADAAQGAVPEGWKLVPIEPTDGMCDAPGVRIGGCYSCSAQLPTWGEHAEIYEKMLAAAPSAQPTDRPHLHYPPTDNGVPK